MTGRRAWAAGSGCFTCVPSHCGCSSSGIAGQQLIDVSDTVRLGPRNESIFGRRDSPWCGITLSYIPAGTVGGGGPGPVDRARVRIRSRRGL